MLESFESLCLGVVIFGLYSFGEVDLLNVVFDMVGVINYYYLIKENSEVYKELMVIYICLVCLFKEEYESIMVF